MKEKQSKQHIILKTVVDRLKNRMMHCKSGSYRILTIHPMGESAYSFDCTFFRPICLTAKALRRMTGFCSSALASCVALPPASLQSCKTSIPYVLYITMCGFLVGAKLPFPAHAPYLHPCRQLSLKNTHSNESNYGF